jgi:hypothetical protein
MARVPALQRRHGIQIRCGSGKPGTCDCEQHQSRNGIVADLRCRMRGHRRLSPAPSAIESAISATPENVPEKARNWREFGGFQVENALPRIADKVRGVLNPSFLSTGHQRSAFRCTTFGIASPEISSRPPIQPSRPQELLAPVDSRNHPAHECQPRQSDCLASPSNPLCTLRVVITFSH